MEEEIYSILIYYKCFHLGKERCNNYELSQIYSDWLLTVEVLTSYWLEVQ